MKRFLFLMLTFLAMPTQSWAFIDASPTLGSIVADSTQIVVLQVDKVSRDRQVIIFKRIADLKGNDSPGLVKHKLTDGFRPQQARAILDWAEPGASAIAFLRGNVCLTCVGSSWYECSASPDSWWIMTIGKPELSYAYRGPTTGLRDYVTAMLVGREVVITALKYQVFTPGTMERKLEGWATYEAVGAGRLMRGKDWPLWRIKASLKMPRFTHEVVQQSKLFIVGNGPGGPEDVPALIKALKHGEAHVRSEAAEDLGLIGPAAADAIPELLQLCQPDADPLIRVAAAKAVASIDPNHDKAVLLLMEALTDKAGKVRKRAAESLGDLGPCAASAVAALTEAVADADPTVSWAAIDALGQIGPKAESAVPTLVEALKDTSTRGAAIDALGQIGRKAQKAIPALEQVLNGDDLAVRWAAAAALVRIGGPGVKSGVRFLVAEAGRDPGKTHYNAANILVSPSAKEALRELIEAVGEPALRDAATAIIRDKWEITNMPLLKDQVPDVMELFKDPDPGVRCVAAWVLHCGRAQVGDAVKINDVIAVLRETLKASDPWARRQAARFLGRLGPTAKDAAASVSAVLEDKDAGVRNAAAEALKRIQK